MVDRINLILRAKNITARQFAEEIGIQPSGMSHILSGRNRPSLDFVMKVVTRYPEIDIKWLTLGEGEMFVHPHSMPVAPSAPPAVSFPEPAVASQPHNDSTEPDLFSSVEVSRVAPVSSVQPQSLNYGEAAAPENVETNPSPSESFSDDQSSAIEGDAPETAFPAVSAAEKAETLAAESTLFAATAAPHIEKNNVKKKKIMKVVILYDDHSFSEYYPE